MQTRLDKAAITILMAALLLWMGGLAIVVAPAEAAGTVTDCTSYGSGMGTLQHALGGGGTVTFACSGTIVVPEITINAGTPTVIDATGYDVTLSGNNANRVFQVPVGRSLTLRNITIANGLVDGWGAGAVVASGGTLTVENSTFTGNSVTGRGGAISSDGTLSIINSAIIGNSTGYVGGGISVNGGGTATIQGSTVSGNSAQSEGGGIYLDPGTTTTVQGSTVSGNSSSGGGGGIINFGDLTVTNSTISGNTMSGSGGGGGLTLSGGTTTLLNSTVTANHSTALAGGIRQWDPATVSLGNTIVAGNTADISGPDMYGTITSNDYNLVGNTSGATFIPQANDITGEAALLSGLGDYGGDTQTVALLPNSPAIDAANDATCPAADQRGVARVGTCDIGAFESQGFSTAYTSGDGQSTTVNTPFLNPLVLSVSSSAGEPVDGGQVIFTAPESGPSLATTPLTATISSGSASQAVEANGEAGTYVVSAEMRGNLNSPVEFTLTNVADCGDNWTVGTEAELNDAIACYNGKTAAGTYTLTVSQDISLTASTTAIDNATSGVELVVEGAGYAVDGQDTADVRPVTTNSATTVTINDLTVTGGNTTVGGGIENYGNLTLNNSTVSGNTSSSNGGGIYVHSSGTLTAANSTVSGNTSSSSGGGIYCSGGTMTLDSATIANNAADSHGGGLYYTGFDQITFRNSILADNTGEAGNDDCASLFGTLIDDGHNLVEAIEAGCQFQDGVNGTIVGQDPVLGPLADNGGDTWTHALVPGSPAIDAGMTDLTTDQRGIARPSGMADDIGAYEATIYRIFLPMIVK